MARTSPNQPGPEVGGSQGFPKNVGVRVCLPRLRPPGQAANSACLSLGCIIYNILVHLFGRYLLNTYCVPGTVLSAADAWVIESKKTNDGLPWWRSGWESATNARDTASSPGLGRSHMPRSN